MFSLLPGENHRIGEHGEPLFIDTSYRLNLEQPMPWRAQTLGVSVARGEVVLAEVVKLSQRGQPMLWGC
jgi:hypothetical protein